MALALVGEMVRAGDKPAILTICEPIWIWWRAPKLLLTLTEIAVLSNVVKGAAFPPLQSTTSSALMVVGSSSVEAVKSGDVMPNALGNPDTTTGAPPLPFPKLSEGANP